MARIRNLDQVSANSSAHPTETDAEWTVVDAGDTKLLQISTFGSDSRVSERKVSQTIQFDRRSAMVLKAAIESAFPGI
ncbi:hypothetical protein BI335_04020 [Enemella evansiae]|uniref:hypothetical protein n=1 Tax=Enemella evansiae TaxID=2016499 RepID=UPI000B969B22|nr:hypothetical protein [Enemella evansiae]OYO19767.1 hypothetical protein BI335_04020 [Enemella evansiae]